MNSSVWMTPAITAILDHDFKTSHRHPAPHLLINHGPRRRIVGQLAPMATGFGDKANSFEDITQRIIPL
jgi:hypothetical protein